MVDCIVLAAGASSRMGAWKLLLPWKGLTVVETVVEEALSCCQRVILVAGYRAADLAELFSADDRVQVVSHTGWRKGQFTSLQRGVATLGPAAGGFFVTLADMPGVTKGLFAELERARDEAGGPVPGFPRAFRPGDATRPGHPVLFEAEAAPLIASLDPALSMREVFPRLDLRFLADASAGAFLDVDVPSDYTTGTLDPARTRCSARLSAEANAAAHRLKSGELA